MREDPPFLHGLFATSDAFQQTHPALEHFEAFNIYQIGAGQTMLGNEYRLAAPAKFLEQLSGPAFEGGNELGTHRMILKYHIAQRKFSEV